MFHVEFQGGGLLLTFLQKKSSIDERQLVVMLEVKIYFDKIQVPITKTLTYLSQFNKKLVSRFPQLEFHNAD